MKKKYLSLIFGLTLSAVVATGIIIASHGSEKEADSETYMYTMTLDKDNQIQFVQSINSDNYSIGKFSTDRGTEIELAYSMFMDIDPSDDFVKMEEDEYFELVNPLNGLIKMEYVADGDATIEYGYNRKIDFPFNNSIVDTRGNVHTIEFTHTYETYGVPPCFFRITSKYGHTLTIHSIKLYYTCVHSPDPSIPVGTWDYESNGYGLTLTGFHIDSDKIPADHALTVPYMINGEMVTQINEGVLSNVPWLDHIVIPFVGENMLLNKEGFSYNFASIFGKNSAHNKYQPIQQYEGTTVNIWYVPKSLNKVTIAGGNIDYESTGVLYHYIPAYGFYGCGPLLRTINITGEIEEVSEFAFTNCSTMKEIILPSTTQKINRGAFTGCNKLFIRTLSKSLDMNDEANPNYRPISIGYKESFIKDGIYYDICTKESDEEYLNVTKIENTIDVLDIPASVEHNGKSYNVKRIANRAFEDQVNLRVVHFGNDLELIGNYILQNCYRASVYIAENPTSHPEKYSAHWSGNLGGEVYLNFMNFNNAGLHYVQASDARFVFGSDGELSDHLDIDVKGFDDVIFPYHAFDDDVRIYKLSFNKYAYFKPYSFANCIHLSEVNFDGTMAEFEQFKLEGHIGFNSFIEIGTNQAHCSDGWVSLD